MIQFVYFSLNKWEMMTNGTGWVCTLSISGFLFHFAVLDHAAATRCRNMSDRVLLAILPILLVVMVAGPYSGGYAVILVLAYGALWLADRRGGAETSSRSWSRKCRRTWCIGALTTVLAMVLYLWSNSQAVYVHRGAVTDVSIAQEFAAQPLFFLRFLLKAVASSVIGAGDSFWGGFLASYLQEETSPEHLTRAQMIQFGRVGNAVASLCVERRGGISAIPEMEEIEERLRG